MGEQRDGNGNKPSSTEVKREEFGLFRTWKVREGTPRNWIQISQKEGTVQLWSVPLSSVKLVLIQVEETGNWNQFPPVSVSAAVYKFCHDDPYSINK